MATSPTPASGRISTRSRLRGVIAAFAVAATVVIPTTLLVDVGPSGAQELPSYTVTPSTGLDPAGDTVSVAGSNYSDDAGLYVRLCKAPTGWSRRHSSVCGAAQSAASASVLVASASASVGWGVAQV